MPLIEDGRLARIFFHIAGDGYAGKFGGSHPHYFNTNRAVVNEFVNDLSTFGIVNVRFQENRARVTFPKVIVHVLKHLYKTSFLSREIRIPQELSSVRRQVIAQGIKALADDEASVCRNRIRIHSSNKRFLEDIFDLMTQKFPSLAEYVSINSTRNNEHYLTIRKNGMKLSSEIIGFTHTQKKKRLDSLVR
ncbi:hypothetical protein AKJ48_03960 [candidate division MSBL1 archaeon SCGC-AAA261O19]|uniref:Homing endonuclease LAGLIDADG domain-containing protein n=1 Tax=candidate division MSBL1 archaeon SCGC-AAA261O19 TaxID=1698277 RepID=A0A133VA97_9EURY|nr:hypothetical protein AKJ48_03960 [candidate division MSBL1 archaeon SCGC-AAA261O19]